MKQFRKSLSNKKMSKRVKEKKAEEEEEEEEEEENFENLQKFSWWKIKYMNYLWFLSKS